MGSISLIVWFFWSTILLAQPAKTDLYGDSLPDGALARIGASRLLNEDTLTWAHVSADGKRIVSGGMYGEHRIYVWEIATGKRLASFPTEPENETWGVAASNDGKRIAALLSRPGRNAYRMWIVVWDVETGEKIADQFSQERDAGWEKMAFSPDGKTLAVRVGAIYLLDLDRSRIARKIDDPKDRVQIMQWVCDGKYLFVDSARSFDLWDPQTGKPLDWLGREKLGESDSLGVRALSSDGKVLVCAGAAEVRVATLRPPTRERAQLQVESIRKFKTTPVDKDRVAISDDGKQFLVGDDQKTLQLFSIEQPKPIREVKFDYHPLTFRFVGDRPLLIDRGKWGHSRQLHVWDFGKHHELGAESTLHYLEGAAQWSADGREILTREQRWEASTGKFLGERKNAPAMKPWRTPEGKGGLLSRDGKTTLVSIARDAPPNFGGGLQRDAPVTGIEVWDVESKKRQISFRDQGVRFPRIYPDHKWHQFPQMLSDDGRIFVDCFFGNLQIWNVESGRLRMEELLQNDSRGNVGVMVVSRDGRRLIALTQNGVVLIDIVSGKIESEFCVKPRHAGWKSLAVSSDWRLAALGADGGECSILDLSSGKQVCSIDTRHGGIAGLAFRFDNRQLLSQDKAGWCLVWNLPPVKLGEPTLAQSDEQRAWEELAGADAARARVWMRRWVATGNPAIAFLGKHVEAEAGIPEIRVRELIQQLGSDRFREREESQRRLAELGEPIVNVLRKEADRSTDTEIQERLRRLIDHPGQRVPLPTGKAIQVLRTIEVLEQIGTPTARKVVERLSKGAEGFPATQEARAALRRWPQ